MKLCPDCQQANNHHSNCPNAELDDVDLAVKVERLQARIDAAIKAIDDYNNDANDHTVWHTIDRIRAILSPSSKR